MKKIINGILFENPILVSTLGLCSALAVTNKVENALVMSICVLIVLILSNTIISIIKKTNTRKRKNSSIYNNNFNTSNNNRNTTKKISTNTTSNTWNIYPINSS